MEDYGGHDRAVGITIKPSNIPELYLRMDKLLGGGSVGSSSRSKEIISIDAYVTFDDLIGMISQISTISPLGRGNSEPVFCLKSVGFTGTGRYFGAENNHFISYIISCSGARFEVVIFNYASKNFRIDSDEKYDIVFTHHIRKSVFQNVVIQIYSVIFRQVCN